MTEYIIIVALIAVTAIGVYSFFGQSIRNQVAGLSQEVAGAGSTEQVKQAKQAADKAHAVAQKQLNLGNYDEGANKAASDKLMLFG